MKSVNCSSVFAMSLAPRNAANAVSEKTRGTGRFDERDKNGAALAEKDDAKLPLRHSGAMWQGDISERPRRCCGEIPAFETSTQPISTRDMWNWPRRPSVWEAYPGLLPDCRLTWS